LIILLKHHCNHRQNYKNQPEVPVTQARDARKVVISGTGLYTPQETISNAELVKSFNAYVELFNAENAADIAAGKIEALSPSSEEFIVKASGIESRYVINKSGVLDPKRLCPSIPERDDEVISVQSEIAVASVRDALAQARKSPEEVDAVIVACSNMQRPYPAMAIEVQNALGIKGYGLVCRQRVMRCCPAPPNVWWW
jgi:beta-ketodecanoyl-[acyl-carrier-protein] synthase